MACAIFCLAERPGHCYLKDLLLTRSTGPLAPGYRSVPYPCAMFAPNGDAANGCAKQSRNDSMGGLVVGCALLLSIVYRHRVSRGDGVHRETHGHYKIEGPPADYTNRL